MCDLLLEGDSARDELPLMKDALYTDICDVQVSNGSYDVIYGYRLGY